jgi:hypothetical protein
VNTNNCCLKQTADEPFVLKGRGLGRRGNAFSLKWSLSASFEGTFPEIVRPKMTLPVEAPEDYS